MTVTADVEAYRSCELMYFFLNRVPTSRAVMSAISERFIVSDKESIFFDNNSYPLMRVLDPWGTELRYWYNGKQGFPVIESAGPIRAQPIIHAAVDP